MEHLGIVVLPLERIAEQQRVHAGALRMRMIRIATQSLRCYSLTESNVTRLVIVLVVGHDASSLNGRPIVSRATYVKQAVVRTLPIARLLNALRHAVSRGVLTIDLVEKVRAVHISLHSFS